MLCKHEVIGSIPFASTSSVFGMRRAMRAAIGATLGISGRTLLFEERFLLDIVKR